MNLIDSHCHIDVETFDADRSDVLERCCELGVSRLLVPGIMARTWPKLREICNQYPGLYPAYGLHPVYVDSHSKNDLDELDRWLQQEKPLAVGEIGLDFYYKQKDLSELDREKQQDLFEAQLSLARTYNLPVILHVRKAHDAVLSILKRFKPKGGICHAFNGSLEQGHQYLDLGFKLGFGGMMTYERSHKLHRLAQALPIEAIVLETDAPDMTGARHHGQRNSPEYLPEALEVLATLRGEDPDTLAEQTTTNVEAIFNLDTDLNK